MNLTMDDKVAENYKSNSQKIRVITEQWVSNNLFCPYCGKEKIIDQLRIFIVQIMRRNTN